jgi:transposase-like protein
MKAKLTEQDKADIVRLAAKGKAIAVLAEDFGVSEQAIRYTLKKHKGAKPLPPFEQPDRQLAADMDTHYAGGGTIGPENPEDITRGAIQGKGLNLQLNVSTIGERITTKLARSAFRKAAQDLSQAMLRDELTEALAEFFPEKPL